MSYFEKISNYFWYISIKNKIQSRIDMAKNTLGYFDSVRQSNMMRQKIGLQDLGCHHLPSLRGKGKITIGCSTDCMNTIIKTAKRELYVLERWRRFKHLSKNPITGKVIFS